MPIDQLALLLLVIVLANLLLLLVLAYAWRSRRPGAENGRQPQQVATDGTITGSRRLLTSAATLPPPVYQRVVRVASLVFILSAMVVVQVMGIGPSPVTQIFLAIAALVTVLFHEVLPPGSLGRWRLAVEALAAIAFLTVLLILTGGHASPFFFGYILLLGAAALWVSGLGAPILALATATAYLIAVLLPFNEVPSTVADIGRIVFNLVALALVAYVSAIVGREQRRAREEALRLSRYDSLTGLHSRDYFLAELEQEIARAARSGRAFALLMFDLDGLKAANDRFGHASGDTLLRAVADTLRGDIRITDVAARWGGDEFVLLLPETDLAGAMLVADKVRIDIGRLALPQDGQVVRTSASIGLVTYPEDGKSSIELMRRADLAMYEAKRRGRDQVVRFARDLKKVGPGVPPKPATVVRMPEASTGADEGIGGEALSGAPTPAVVVEPEGALPNERRPKGPSDQSTVPPASAGRAPWESTGD